MMVLATGVTIFLLTYILPKFTPLFKSQGHASCPTPTLMMMALSDAMLRLLVPLARRAPWRWWPACSTAGAPRRAGRSSTG